MISRAFLESHRQTLHGIAAACRASLRIGPVTWGATALLCRPGATGLSIGTNTQQPGRLTFTPCHILPDNTPADENGAIQPQYAALYGSGISCAISRDPEKIAADLDRRAWPSARKWAQEHHNAVSAKKLEGIARQSRLDQLAAILGEPIYSRSGETQFRNLSVTDPTWNSYTVTIQTAYWPAVLQLAKITAAEITLQPE